MKIAMFSNTYLPHVGGVARSVSTFSEAYRSLGHECLIVAPEFEETIPDEKDTYRVPAIKNFNDSGFSFQLPFTGDISEVMEEFDPDIIHAHHPFLLGDTALRFAYSRDIPIVFTHHTLYEQYTNYLPFESDFTKSAAMEIATNFANTCSLIFAPSTSVAELIKTRGVNVPVVVQPTGIDIANARSGNGKNFRSKHDIPEDLLIVGHVGRIAKEKNLEFLTGAVCEALKEHEKAYFVLVGSGELEERLKDLVEERGMTNRVLSTGSLQGQDLVDAYASFDLFAFSSQSETQGLVIAEAMAGKTPVIALEGPGVADIVEHEKNGILMAADTSEHDYAKAMVELLRAPEKLTEFRERAWESANALSIENVATNALSHYEQVAATHQPRIDSTGIEDFDKLIANIEGELQLLKVKANTIAGAITS